MGAKGCVIFAAEPLREYRDYLTKVDGELSTLAWLYHMNHGIFMTPGVEEEWTLSIAHSDDDVERYVNAFETFARDVTSGLIAALVVVQHPPQAVAELLDVRAQPVGVVVSPALEVLEVGAVVGHRVPDDVSHLDPVALLEPGDKAQSAVDLRLAMEDLAVRPVGA